LAFLEHLQVVKVDIKEMVEAKTVTMKKTKTPTDVTWLKLMFDREEIE
jgi:hypothetical protein